MPVSTSSTTRIIATIVGTIPIAFGINAFVNPWHALSFFELSKPTINSDVAEALLLVYGARDVFMGLSICATAYYGDRRALGWILIAASAVAVFDGWVTKTYAGQGEWGHWGYAPALTGLGVVFLGAFDG
jgi:hypothetical protein